MQRGYGVFVRKVAVCQILAFLTIFKGGVNDLNAGLNFANQSSTLSIGGANSQLVLNTPINISGTLVVKNNLASTISGSATNTITFDKGLLNSGTAQAALTAIYSPVGTQSILLAGDDSIQILSGQLLLPVIASSGNNSLTGTPILTQMVSLQDSNTTLNLDINNNLSQNVVLNGGTVVLAGDVRLDDEVKIIGPGVIHGNNHTLYLPGSPDSAWTANLDWTGQVSIDLNALTVLSSTWNFTQAGGTSTINGDGNILDMTAGGVIQLANDFTLFINNVNLKGLGTASSLGRFIMLNDGAKVILSGCTLDLADDYALNVGQIWFKGNNSIMFTKNFTFSINNGALLAVDGIALTWDKLYLANLTNPILPASPANQSLFNGGVIRTLSSPSLPTYIYDSSTTLDTNIDITGASPLIFTNSTPLVSKAVSLQGNGHFIQFSRSNNGNFIIQDNITLTLSYVVLKDFNPANISYGTNSNIIFGNGVIWEIGSDLTLSQSFNIGGNVTIDGRGGNLTLANADSLLCTASNSALTLKDVHLYGLGGVGIDAGTGRLRLATNTTGLILENSDIFMDADYNFATGYLQINGVSNIYGEGKTLTYSTTVASQVSSNSILRLQAGVTFTYAPTNNSQSLLTFVDSSSQLWLNSSTLISGSMGLELNTGTMVLQNSPTLQAQGYIINSNALTIANSMNIVVQGGGAPQLVGQIILQ